MGQSIFSGATPRGLFHGILVFVIAAGCCRAEWKHVFGAVEGMSVESFVVSGGEIFASTRGPNAVTNGGSVFRSSDSGTTWTQFKTTATIAVFTSFAAIGGTLFAGTAGEGLYRSTDRAASWTQASIGSIWNYFNCLTLMESTLFASVDGDIVYRSTDTGASWKEFRIGHATDFGLPIIHCFAVSGAALLAGTSQGLFVSSDRGATWSRRDESLAQTNVFSLAVNGEVILAGTDKDDILRSTDGGATWSTVYNGILNSKVFAIAVLGTDFFAGVDGSVRCSSDNGATWTQYNVENQGISVLAFASLGGRLFAGTKDRGAWMRPISELTSLLAPSRPIRLATGFESALGSVVHPGASIWFSTGRQARANLGVYNARGVKVVTLISALLPPGLHQAVFDGDGLSPGPYYFRLESGGINRSHTIVLEKRSGR